MSFQFLTSIQNETHRKKEFQNRKEQWRVQDNQK